MKILNYFLILAIIFIIIFIPTKIFAADTLDSVVTGADSFLEKGKTTTIDTTELKSASNFIYNILLGVALIMAVSIGMVLGIKYMTADAENKAKIKETLVPYTISVVVMFGAFAIWKLVIDVLSGI